MKKTKSGVTLVELAVVVLISGFIILPLGILGVVMANSQRRVTINQELQSEALMILDIIERRISQAESVNIYNYSNGGTYIDIYLPFPDPLGTSSQNGHTRIYYSGSSHYYYFFDYPQGISWQILSRHGANGVQFTHTSGSDLVTVKLVMSKEDVTYTIQRTFRMQNY